MAPIYKSPTGETLDIPARGIHSMEALGWVPANTTEAKAATAEAEADDEAQSTNSETETEDTTEHKSEELPAGNASHDTWHAYALADGMAADELEDLNRNQIRDLFIE